MDRNVKIARELVRLAKSLVAADDVEQELKDFNSKCYKEFAKKIKADGNTVNGEYSNETEINGKKVEVQMFTYSKNSKPEFKYYVSVDGESFEDIVEAEVKTPFKADSTYDFICNSEEDAQKFLEEYLDSVRLIVGTANGIDDAFEKAIEKLKENGNE